MPELFDPVLVKTLQRDQEALATSAVPIVTVSASFKEDLKGMYGFPEDDSIPDVVFSRAHYSMALALATSAWGRSIDAKKAWIFDPTNYVSHQDWRSILLTELVGKTIARHSILKSVKDLIDRFGRKKLPILDSITPPLLFATSEVKQPILSLHIAAGNILAAQGKTVLQVITDPHVRADYLQFAEAKNMQYCVFDEQTKQDFLEKAALLELKVDPAKITVTGPPVDPRIIAAGKKKQPWRSGPLNVCITTGGLGTNKSEILKILRQLMPELRRRPSPYRVLVYAGTQSDIAEAVLALASEERVTAGELEDSDAKLRVIYHSQIVDANEQLTRYGFPWAHCMITKPSGDMAYDAAASGSCILTLAEWGEWEDVIREVFVQRGIARAAITDHIVTQLESLTATTSKPHSWVERAQLNAFNLDPLFRSGSANILKTYQKLAKQA
jgi:hypothetical protein